MDLIYYGLVPVQYCTAGEWFRVLFCLSELLAAVAIAS
jgi:hypothetical protein